MSQRAEEVKARIRSAFANVEYPGDWCLRDSNEGEEPYLVEQEFKGKTDWTVLDAAFIDRAPNGFGTALSFFSDEAFHFYSTCRRISSPTSTGNWTGTIRRFS